MVKSVEKPTKNKKLGGMEVPHESVPKLEREKEHHRKHSKVDPDKKKDKNKILLRRERKNY
jgi:hypothetical protein